MLQAVATEQPTMMDALDFEAPYLIDKLQMECIVRSAEEAAALFAEVKRYIVLVRTDTSKVWEMHSLRVDAAWHQFVLYTFQYSEFCQRYFGRYIHHSPSNAPEVKQAVAKPVASFDMFKARYEELFGQPLPQVWLDETSVCVESRIGNQMAGRLTLGRDGELVHLISPSGQTLFSVNDIAEPAMAFIAKTGAFYVRELPGGLTDDERMALISELVRLRLLRAGG
jgi:hypothetical protein